MIDTLNHHASNLLANLYTGIVSGFLLVITRIDTVVQTTDKFVYISGIHAQAHHDVIPQTLRLGQTERIAHRINVGLQVCLGSRIATTHESGSG